MLLQHLLTIGAFASTALAGELSVPKIDFVISRGNSYEESQVGARVGIKRTFNSKRNEVELELTNQLSFYLAKVSVGSNDQEMEVLIDTGSSDFWLLSSNVVCVDMDWLAGLSILARRSLFKRDLMSHRRPTRVFKAKDVPDKVKVESIGTTNDINSQYSTLTSYQTTDTCTLLGSFNTDTSDTFKANSSDPDFYSQYADGTEVVGVWSVDSVFIGNLTLKDVTFGVGEVATAQPGILGIGMMSLESTYSPLVPGSRTYVNFPAKLKEEGLIARNAFSLYLTDDAGTVLFGAVDTAKYEGTLFSLPLVNTLAPYGYRKPAEFAVALSALTLKLGNESVTILDTNYGALLDSGTTLSYFPESVMANLAEALGAQFVSSTQLYQLDCPSSGLELEYDFNGGKITIPIDSLITKDRGLCYLNILPNTGASSYLFGDNFLRHVYVVYDADALEISMAPIKDTNDSNVLVLSEVVSATQVTGYSNTVIATIDASQGTVSSALATSGVSASTSSKANDAMGVNVSVTSLFGAFLFSVMCLFM